MLDGMNLLVESKGSRVEITQEAITNRGLTLYEVLQLALIQFGFGNRLEHADVVQTIRRNLMSGHQLRPAEEVSLEINKALFASSVELLS